jgi:hypothetical protein
MGGLAFRWEYVVTGLILTLAGCNQEQPLPENRVPVTPSEMATQVPSPLVTPGQSRDVRSLSTAPPMSPGTRVYEINPRGHPPGPTTPEPEVTPTPSPNHE